MWAVFTPLSRGQTLQSNDPAFYDRVPPLPSFQEASLGTVAHNVPVDWHVVVADVEGSTDAIQAGRYKQVNMLGAAVIACARNLSIPFSVPFVFGGDGATLAVPGHVIPRLRSGLAAVRKMGIDAFGLRIRIATVPAAELIAKGLDLRICKYTLSPTNDLAAWFGDGWVAAEEMLKQGSLPGDAAIPEGFDGSTDDMDLTGLQCRWDFIEAKRGFKSCFIVVPRTTDPAQRMHALTRISALLARESGAGAATAGVSIPDLKLTLNSSLLQAESGARSRGLAVLLLANLASRILFLAGRFLPRVPGRNYRSELIENTDFIKFDGALKFVVDCSKESLRDLIRACDELESEGLIRYGQHSSRRAILTCLVPSFERHIHFIDGSDGGYAMAAKVLKTKLRRG